MNKKTVKATAILLATILASAPQAVSAAGKTELPQNARSTAPKTSHQAWKIGLGNGVTATLEQADVWQQNGGHVVIFTLNYKNGGKSGARLMSYFPKVAQPEAA
ncbi:hypothetical protein [Paenibacillus sp. DMB20]|uniref:hypothetical protein n=1 Tax=Paenibacillus sp. DMB20 TaxID=1642570 RepID=UPI000AFB73D5|nr:hypothetical protein [Paenibacillus sp. DMB20]